MQEELVNDQFIRIHKNNWVTIGQAGMNALKTYEDFQYLWEPFVEELIEEVSKVKNNDISERNL
jgi:hypothetical protein